jgi:hypothetical protein
MRPDPRYSTAIDCVSAHAKGVVPLLRSIHGPLHAPDVARTPTLHVIRHRSLSLGTAHLPKNDGHAISTALQSP